MESPKRKRDWIPTVERSFERSRWESQLMRAVAWKHWKRGPARCRQWMRRGVPRAEAVHAAWRYHSPWHASRTKAINVALPNALWDRLGLLRLYTA